MMEGPNDELSVPSHIRYIKRRINYDVGSGESSINTTTTTTTISIRQGHLTSFHGLTWEDELDYVGVTRFASVYLAFRHFNERNGTVLPHIPTLFEGCDFYWTLEARDTDYSRRQAIQGLVDATTNTTRTTAAPENENQSTTTTTAEGKVDDEWQHPYAMVGAMMSGVSQSLAILGQTYGMPIISSSSGSPALDKELMFARTNPTTETTAYAAMTYYKSLEVTHVALLYVLGTSSNYVHHFLQQAAKQQQIVLRSFPYLDENQNDITATIQQLAESKLRYIILYNGNTWKDIFEMAYDYGIMGAGSGSNYSWIVFRQDDWTRPEFQLSRTDPRDQKLARAVNGLGTIWPTVDDDEESNEINNRFAFAMEDFANNEGMEQEFLDSFVEDPPILQDITFPRPLPDNFRPYTLMAYDAVMALGLASCRTPGLFTGPQLYHTLVNLQPFRGVSGLVSFDNVTGNRRADSQPHQIYNIFYSQNRSDENHIRFDNNVAFRIANGQVQQLLPYIYSDNTTVPPLPLPPIEQYEYNLIPYGALLVGWLLAGLVMLLSLSIMIWIYVKRRTEVVWVSQPAFLSMLCAGTFIMTSAVIPMSFQGEESTPGLDAACMITPWLIVLGFVIAFSALFSKTYRLNKLLGSGMAMRRITVKAKDVIWPFVVLLLLNVILLLGWTIISPLQYQRTEVTNYDNFGRSVESYGMCKHQDQNYLYFVIPLFLFDFVGLVVSAYQCYKARHLPTKLSESRYLAISVGSLLETLIVGGPIMFVVLDNPTAYYLVGSFLICTGAMTILLPIFLPKYLQRNDDDINGGGRPGNLISAHSYHSAGHGMDHSEGSHRISGSNARRFTQAESDYESMTPEMLEIMHRSGYTAITSRDSDAHAHTNLRRPSFPSSGVQAERDKSCTPDSSGKC